MNTRLYRKRQRQFRYVGRGCFVFIKLQGSLLLEFLEKSSRSGVAYCRTSGFGSGTLSGITVVLLVCVRRGFYLVKSFDAKISQTIYKTGVKVLLFRSTHSNAETALLFGIHKSMVNKWLLKKDEPNYFAA